MTIHAKLMADIDAFLKRTGMPQTTFGSASPFKNPHIVRRLRIGQSITVQRVDALYAWMREYEGNGQRRKPRQKGKRAENRAA